MPWLLDEDDALKAKLSGFSVTNYADGRAKPIAVYFRFPDSEERQRTFPHIAIDLVEITFAPDRAHRVANEFILDYDTETATPLNGFSLAAYDFPLPWNLVYQLAAYSRLPRDDRWLTSLLFQQFPEEFGSLDMTNFDGTVRRADLVSVVRRDTVDASQHRLYRNIFTVSVSSEFFLGQVYAIQQSTGVNVTVIPYADQPFPVSA